MKQKMKKVGIVTIRDLNNYGNRLQNYAVQSTINKLGYKAISLNNLDKANMNNTKIKNFIIILRRRIRLTYENFKRYGRYRKFCKFDKNIKTTRKLITMNNAKRCFEKKYNFFIVGSDQVWNHNFKRLSDIELLSFAPNEKRISFSASFGISKLPDEHKERVKKELEKFKNISVREDAGKSIIDELLPKRDVEVLVDPTMLLTAEEWDKVSKKPRQLKTTKYILNYFLGELSNERKNEINRIAKENDCEVINILDKNEKFYKTGPSEFLYLEKNAFLICTDSFHSCVFAILYDRPFIVFDREDKTVSMNSRIETLINKFNLKNRKFNKKITKENLQHDYTDAYKILESEREKSYRFLKKALDME